MRFPRSESAPGSPGRDVLDGPSACSFFFAVGDDPTLSSVGLVLGQCHLRGVAWTACCPGPRGRPGRLSRTGGCVLLCRTRISARTLKKLVASCLLALPRNETDPEIWGSLTLSPHVRIGVSPRRGVRRMGQHPCPAAHRGHPPAPPRRQPQGGCRPPRSPLARCHRHLHQGRPAASRFQAGDYVAIHQSTKCGPTPTQVGQILSVNVALGRSSNQFSNASRTTISS